MPEDVRLTAAALDTADATALLARLLTRLIVVLDEFSVAGFAALRSRWEARCAHLDAVVNLLADNAPPRQGVCRGVDADGALRLETPAGIERILSGDISLRVA
jgi:BirA family biotin operon repressor/biotin-[acetyl-CoA-carboxylase] ligase